MPCCRKASLEQGAAAHLVADALDVGAELGIGQALGQQVEGFQDRQSGADQRDELLVEDQELLQVQLLTAAEEPDPPTPPARALIE